jgi:hypothetical protein
MATASLLSRSVFFILFGAIAFTDIRGADKEPLYDGIETHFQSAPIPKPYKDLPQKAKVTEFTFPRAKIQKSPTPFLSTLFNQAQTPIPLRPTGPLPRARSGAALKRFSPVAEH